MRSPIWQRPTLQITSGNRQAFSFIPKAPNYPSIAPKAPNYSYFVPPASKPSCPLPPSCSHTTTQPHSRRRETITKPKLKLWFLFHNKSYSFCISIPYVHHHNFNFGKHPILTSVGREKALPFNNL